MKKNSRKQTPTEPEKKQIFFIVCETSVRVCGLNKQEAL
jgi:hypothetical protein